MKTYVLHDGFIATYFPDFMLNIGDSIYLVETKAQKDLDNANVQSKEKSAYRWISKTSIHLWKMVDHKWAVKNRNYEKSFK